MCEHQEGKEVAQKRSHPVSGARLLNMPKDIIIAIDGFSGCGKSTTAKAVAGTLGYTYIDSGAMYRATTLYFLHHQVALTDDKAVEKALQQLHIAFRPADDGQKYEIYLNGENVEEEIRQMKVSGSVSAVSAIPQVRKAMVALQRAMGAGKKVVMDGRDIGTNVFPHAELKIFMTADTMVRAARRKKELLEKGHKVSLEEIKRNLEERDTIDSGRTENPLRKAEDAIEIDTSHLTFEEQVDKVLDLARNIIFPE